MVTPDRLHSDTVGRVTNKVRVEGGGFVPKYRSSDAFPATEIFFFLDDDKVLSLIVAYVMK